jgi:glycerol-3-phosphate dehydrogenase
VYSGLLPATEQGSTELTSKPLIHDHGGNGGARGLFSVSGVKYTTARDVAEKTLRRAFAGLGEIGEETGRPQGRVIPAIGAAADGNTGDNLAEAVRRFADDEAVVHLDDLLLRRGDWGDDPRTLQRTGQAVAEMLGWDQARRGAELDRLAELTDAGSSGECS